MNNMERFTNVPKVEIPRAMFNRSHTLKTTFDGDYLVPILCQEIYPGDTLQVSLDFMARMATPLFPIMDDVYLETFFFFVPNRIVWEKWRRFVGERHPDPNTSIDLTVPVVTLDTDWSAAHGNLADYFGLPMIDYNTENVTVNTLPFRGYQKIWNEWFRDENLQNSNDFGFEDGDGPDADSAATYDTDLMYLQKRNKRHDRFTSALPWLQKGDAISLPLGTRAEIFTDGVDDTSITVYAAGATAQAYLDTAGAAGDHVKVDTGGAPPAADSLYADLSGATAATVNEVRQAFQTQRLLEKDARAGTRFPELLKSHFGTDFFDLTYRPEYLGGGQVSLQITPVANTDMSVGSANEGAFLSGAGTAVGNGHGFIKSFQEHGFVIGLINARASLTYQEGLEKMWTRSTRYDFMWPTLCNIGEEAILNKELALDDTMITAGDDDGVFGYQERNSELKYQPGRITGDMRSNSSSSLDAWHLAEELGDGVGGFPILNAAFITSSSPWARVQATSSEPDFIFDGFFNMKHTRTMPVYSLPGMIDHF